MCKTYADENAFTFLNLQFSISCLPYIQYCLDQSSAQDYCRRMDQMNPLFKGYLAVS